MSDNKILLDHDGSVAYLTLNNPAKHNAISLSMFDRIRQILKELATDSTTRVLVIRGAGSKAFAAGADISEFESQRSTPEEIESYVARSEPAYAEVNTFPKPTVAMIQGWCVGGGFALASACDLRICSDTALSMAFPMGALSRGRWRTSPTARATYLPSKAGSFRQIRRAS